MNNKLVAVFAFILLIVLAILLFSAGYERGAAVIHIQDAAMQTGGPCPKANVLKVASVQQRIDKAAATMPDKRGINTKNLGIASRLFDDADNELADEINYEFNRRTPLIMSGDKSDDYTIDALAEEGGENGGEFDPSGLYDIKSEIFVYVGMMSVADAVVAAEFVQHTGIPGHIKKMKLNGSDYTFVIAGPLLLKADAQRLVKYLKDNGYESAKIIE